MFPEAGGLRLPLGLQPVLQFVSGRLASAHVNLVSTALDEFFIACRHSIRLTLVLHSLCFHNIPSLAGVPAVELRRPPIFISAILLRRLKKTMG